MSSLPERVSASIRNRQLIRKGQSCLVAVSGGLDSMVLLHLLALLSESNRWKLTVAHFNHRLRGQSSDADERLVQRTARHLGLPFVRGAGDVKKAARSGGTSLEMAGRTLRHEFLARTASRLKVATIVLAHHADDQVELFFLRLFRGSSGEGLGGMKWRSRSPVDPKIELVRPLLAESKPELAAYAAANRIQFREDASNDSLSIQRNRIRNELLPLLRRKYQPSLQRTILRVSELIGAEAEFVSSLAKNWLKRARPGESSARRESFDSLPVALQRRVVQQQLFELGIVPDFETIERLRTCPETPVMMLQKRRSLDDSHNCIPEREAKGGRISQVVRDQDGMVRLKGFSEASFRMSETEVQLIAPEGEAFFSGVRFEWGFESPGRKPSRLVGREFFDADKVGDSIVLRHWRPGDRFQPIGMNKAVKLQDFFTNEKVRREKRHELIVAQTVQGEVFWVEGLRIAERFKLTERTNRRLKWQWRRI